MPAPTSELDEEPDDGLPIPIGAVRDLRVARRRRRVAEVHWVDALYRVYMAALVGLVGIVAVAGAVGGDPLSPTEVADLERHGPAAIGLLAAVVVGLGLRSGSRGGPLALEAGDVRHVLLAPVDRAAALRGPALRQVRSRLFVAVLLGAAVGLFASERLPESATAWIATGAVTGAVVVVLGLGSALLASGNRVPRAAATALAALLVGWSAADLAGVEVGGSALPASPGRAVGWLALVPLAPHAAAAFAALVAVGVMAVGLWRIGGTSLEAAERRTALVGQIRFAATLQDVRTVLVLRRQLAADHPRLRPWVRLRRPARRPTWRRGWAGLLRFPAVRVARVVVLALVAAAALRGAWAGNPALVALAGVALWVAGLDLIEPLAEEIDHPSRRDAYPVEPGTLHSRLLAAPLTAGALVGLGVAAASAVPGPGALPVEVAVVAGMATTVLGVVGGAGTVLSGAPSGGEELSMIAPEVAGLRIVARSVWPPLLAVLGAAPVLVAEAAQSRGESALGATASLWLVVAALGGVALSWVHQRDAVREWWNQAMETAQSGSAARAGARDDEPDDDADDEERP